MKQPYMHDYTSEETVNIKDHKEIEMSPLDSGSPAYLGGMDPGMYAERQVKELSENIRKHHAK